MLTRMVNGVEVALSADEEKNTRAEWLRNEKAAAVAASQPTKKEWAAQLIAEGKLAEALTILVNLL